MSAIFKRLPYSLLRRTFFLITLSATVSSAQDKPPASAVPEEVSFAAPPTRTVTTALIFRGVSDRASRLQWTSGTVTYQGNVSAAGGAVAMFKMLGGDKYHCQSGTLVPNDPQSTTPLKPALLLESTDGKSLIVDLSGAELQYSGSLTMDETGKAFFQEVWKLCHCQQP